MSNTKRNIRVILVVMTALYILLTVYFSYTLYIYGDRWFSDPNNTRMDIANPRIIPGDILDRNYVQLAYTKKEHRENGDENYIRSYHKDSYYAAHVIGSRQYGIGAEALYVRYLLGYDNNFLERIYRKAFMQQERGDDVVLTIDMRLQKYISKALGDRSGGVVLLNPQNGEILAMVSHPAFYPDDDSEEDLKDDSLFNKALLGQYPPGSIMKVVTAAAALQNIEGVADRIFECDGQTDLGGFSIMCYNQQAHGKVDIYKAMEVSCNAYFASLSVELGWKQLLAVANNFGFNRDFMFPDIRVTKSKFSVHKNSHNEELAWTGIGQGKGLVTPLHMALIVGAIANDGNMMEPRLIKGIQGRNYRVRPLNNPKVLLTPMDLYIAMDIKDMMENVVLNGTGKDAQTGDILIAGKTGTAETKKGELPHAWFIGFESSARPTLAIAVVIENAGTGGGQAAPLAGSILTEAVRLGH